MSLFQQSMEALFGVAYTLKFSSKLSFQKLDWTMMPSEAMWWVEGSESFEKPDTIIRFAVSKRN